MKIEKDSVRGLQELIETLWNVNLIPPDLFRRGKGINRNIVECK